MFQKKQKPIPPTLRQRQAPANRGNSSVFSYHASRSAPASNTGRIEEAARNALTTSRRGQRRWSQRGLAVLAIALLATGVVFNLILSNQVTVLPVTDVKAAVFLRSQEVYAQAAQNVIAQSPQNKTKLTINAAKLEQQLRDQFPELADVTVSIPFIGRQPVVYIQPAVPQLMLSTGNGTAFIVDSTGRVLMDASKLAHVEKLKLPVVNDESGLLAAVGHPVLPSSSVAFITEVVGQLKAKDTTIASMILPAGTNELDVRVSGAAYTVKFNLRGNAREEAGAYLAVKDELSHQGKTAANYIDVRVKDRAYYK